MKPIAVYTLQQDLYRYAKKNYFLPNRISLTTNLTVNFVAAEKPIYLKLKV